MSKRGKAVIFPTGQVGRQRGATAWDDRARNSVAAASKIIATYTMKKLFFHLGAL